MKRDILKDLHQWKHSKRRKPLILKGARQVGKTHALTQFAKKAYQGLAYINFEEMSDAADLFFGSLAPDTVLPKLQIYLDCKIEPASTLLFFDEIQACPNALNSLKYFNESANQYHIVSAGSLLGVKLANSKGFPVGKVNFMQMYPLTFFEFLSAIGKSKLREMLEDIKVFDAISEPFHTKLMDLAKTYIFVGGMPEAVSVFSNENDFKQVRSIHKEILKSYDLDFSKHVNSPNDTLKISAVWQSIPKQLAKENKKFIYSVLRKSARGREYETAIQWLTDASLIHKVMQISRPLIPLNAYVNTDVFKTYSVDVGLLAAMCELNPKTLLAGSDLYREFNGALIENFVAQELIANHQKPLYYWTSEGRAEIDFVASYEDLIFPLEVKSGFTRYKKSLIAYNEKYNPPLLARISPRNLTRDGKFTNYPLYLANKFPYLGFLSLDEDTK